MLNRDVSCYGGFIEVDFIKSTVKLGLIEKLLTGITTGSLVLPEVHASNR